MEVGTMVAFLDEPGKGRVTKIIDESTVLVALDDGIEIPVAIAKLVIQQKVRAEIPSEEVFKAMKDKVRQDTSQPARKKHSKAKEATTEIQEVDLHIEELVSSHTHMTNSEILSIQIEYCQNRIEAAIAGNVRGIYLIHGVGDGVLRKAVHELLSSYQNLEYFDAPYNRFGYGATEVRFYNTQ